jgi:hypothetical protein
MHEDAAVTYCYPREGHTAFMSYDRELPACFSPRDLLLAMDDAEEYRTFRWLIKLRSEQRTWSEVKAQIEVFLRERGAGPLHILDQIDRAAVLLKPWLRPPANDE